MGNTIQHLLSCTKHRSTLLMVTAIATTLTMCGCGRLTRFHITNQSGKAISVTSGHTNKTVQIRDGKAAFVPHGSGNITVTLPGGKTWVYTNLSPQQLSGTSFLEHKSYVLFRCQDGYVFRGSSTAHLVLTKDGRLYVVTSDVRETDVETLEQPDGFPVEPDTSRPVTLSKREANESRP